MLDIPLDVRNKFRMVSGVRKGSDMKISGIEAALSEAGGHGELYISGRTICFKRAGFIVSWPCKTTREAMTQLNIFRAAPKYAKGSVNG